MIVFVAFALVMLLLIAFFYLRDKSVFQKLHAYERAIDDLNNRLYELEVKQELAPQAPSEMIDTSAEVTKALQEVEDRLDEKLHEVGEPLLRTIRAIKTLESNFETLDERLSSRLERIESERKISGNNDENSGANETRIIDLYKEGMSIEKIAKKERVPQGEVELILRIAKLR